jgi:hypothetical protein
MWSVIGLEDRHNVAQPKNLQKQVSNFCRGEPFLTFLKKSPSMNKAAKRNMIA